LFAKCDAFFIRTTLYVTSICQNFGKKDKIIWNSIILLQLS